MPPYVEAVFGRVLLSIASSEQPPGVAKMVTPRDELYCQITRGHRNSGIIAIVLLVKKEAIDHNYSLQT